MSPSHKIRHLILVQKDRVPAAAADQVAQLMFPFIQQREGTWVVNVNQYDRHSFIKLLYECQPSLIADIRIIPRLDILASSRSYAYQLFHQFNIKYVDLFARLNVSSYSDVKANPAFWGGHFSELRAKHAGCAFILCDNQMLLEATNHILNVPIKLRTSPQLKRM